MMMVDDQSWVNIQAYLMDGFKCILILLNLEKLIDNGTIDNITVVILNCLLVYGGLTIEEINSKFIHFDCDGCFPKAMTIGVYQVGGNFNCHGFG
jgi:hypothetical protein